MSAEQVAQDHYRAQRLLSAAAARAAADAWQQIDPDLIVESWTRQVDRVFLAVSGAQQAAAGQADGYLAAVLAEQGIATGSDGQIAAGAFAGIASDGRDLRSLLVQPANLATYALASGRSRAEALASGRASLDMIVRTQVADAGRTADQVALTAHRSASGYMRLLVPPACSRCVILAGRWYPYSAGFRRHPRCLPAGVVVTGPATLAATRRRFQGELVIVSTASGEQLPVTGNHPVLTRRGWVPAHLLQEGDEVVRSTRGQGATALVVPDEDQVPARIENLWRPDGVVTLDHVPTAPEDFHGDGGHGKVDVVLADRLLRYGLDTALAQLAEQEQFAERVAQSALLPQLRPAQHPVLRVADPTNGIVRGGGLCPTIVGRHATRAYLPGCGHAADLDSGLGEVATHNTAGDAIPTAETVLTLASAVRRREIIARQLSDSARWDPPAGPFTVESRVAYACRGQDLLLRLAGQVELDRVVEIRRVEWSGHVYNLTSVEGWYSANRLIVSNCDCRHIPSTRGEARDVGFDPRAYFDSLTEAEQDRIFTRAGAQAIRDGADINQVVNARRGMSTAAGPAGRRRLAPDPSGRFTTSESTTRFGRARPGRLMPEEIYRQARSRAEAVALLRRNGYLRASPRPVRPAAPPPIAQPAVQPGPQRIPVAPVKMGRTAATQQVAAELERQGSLAPRAAGQLRVVDTDFRAEPGVLGHYDLNFREMHLHPDWDRPDSPNRELVRKSVASGWWTPTGAAGPLQTVVAHEYGHHITSVMFARMTPAGARQLLQVVRDQVGIPMSIEPAGTAMATLMRQITNAVSNHPQVVLEVSGYAAKNGYELLAEVWQEYSTMGERARPHIRAIGDVMRDLAEAAL